MNFKRINITFDETSPSIQYPTYKLTPYNSQNTFFHYEAFWSLYLPYTVTFRLTDIWRSYWSQRLMWLLNETITYNGPNAFQLRNSHSYLKDFELEKSMYSKTEQLVEFLFKWKCSKRKFYECVIDLSRDMAVEKFWEMEEVDSINNWLSDLNDIGYVEPKIVNHESNTFTCTESKSNNDPTAYFPVRYTPKFQKSIDLDNYCCDGKIEEIHNTYESVKALNDFCSLSNASLKYDLNSFQKKPNYSNIILLITFNGEPYVKNIELIRHIYGSYFKNIIFCAKNIISVLKETRFSFKKFDSFTFIDIDVGVVGVSHYFCMTKAIEMQFSTEGILLMSDDVMLKLWNLDKYDVKKIWFPFKLECQHELDINSDKTGWVHWTKGAINQLTNIWNHFEKILNGTIVVDNEYIDITKKYIDTNSLNSISSNDSSKKTKICSCFGSDIFYLPKSYFKQFHFISMIFKTYDLHLEIALPAILAGMEINSLIQIISGEYLWHLEFIDFNDIEYKKILDFVHPCKFSYFIASSNGKKFCEKFIQEVFNLIL